ncbi:MAG: RNA polymerase sigma factor [Bacteroidales bacterium]|nr:RNA polymerase sigma factor [Bacteroidales bacterium]
MRHRRPELHELRLRNLSRFRRSARPLRSHLPRHRPELPRSLLSYPQRHQRLIRHPHIAVTREQFIFHVETTQKAFRRFLVALCCGDADLADDIAQESYIKAYLSCDSFTNVEKFNAWIFKIGYNTFLNHKRTERPMLGYETIRDHTGHDSADSSFAYQELYHALNQISDKERTSILLYYIQGYAIKEIAEIQDTSEDAVKKHLSRGRTHLRGLLTIH